MYTTKKKKWVELLLKFHSYRRSSQSPKKIHMETPSSCSLYSTRSFCLYPLSISLYRTPPSILSILHRQPGVYRCVCIFLTESVNSKSPNFTLCLILHLNHPYPHPNILYLTTPYPNHPHPIYIPPLPFDLASSLLQPYIPTIHHTTPTFTPSLTICIYPSPATTSTKPRIYPTNHPTVPQLSPILPHHSILLLHIPPPPSFHHQPSTNLNHPPWFILIVTLTPSYDTSVSPTNSQPHPPPP